MDSEQSFANYARNPLLCASPKMGGMRPPTAKLSDIVARNVRMLFERSRFKSRRALAEAAGVAPNSIRHLLEPERRPMASRPDATPRLDVLEKIAAALGVTVQQLLSGDFNPDDPPSRMLTRSEAEFYARIRSAYDDLGKPGGLAN